MCTSGVCARRKTYRTVEIAGAPSPLGANRIGPAARTGAVRQYNGIPIVTPAQAIKTIAT